MQESKATLDTWQKALQKKKEELEACQSQQGLKSCTKCTALLQCELRDSYVKAVYESMSKGAGGGFEF